MKINHKIIIFFNYLCIIILTMILFSFIFNIITKRLFGNVELKTKYYYIEIFSILIILAIILLYLKINIIKYNNKKIIQYIKLNDINTEYKNLYTEINDLGKLYLIFIIGGLILFLGYKQHTFKEKVSLLNEDLTLFSETFI
jgi:hypothetical protein